MEWISVKDRLPEEGELCDIWVAGNEGEFHRRTGYVFVPGVGVSDKRPAFQDKAYNDNGLYEMAFFLDENLVSHWTPVTYPDGRPPKKGTRQVLVYHTLSKKVFDVDRNLSNVDALNAGLALAHKERNTVGNGWELTNDKPFLAVVSDSDKVNTDYQVESFEG